MNLAGLMPKGKQDTERAEQLVALGFAAIEGVVGELLEWTQDINWPVSQVLCPFFAKVGKPIAPHIHAIFETGDGAWKHDVLRYIVSESADLQLALVQDVERIAFNPTQDEKAEEADLAAREILDRRR